MNGHADPIDVTLHKDGKSVTVADNGRGIPVDMHPEAQEARAGGDLHARCTPAASSTAATTSPLRRPARRRQLVVNALSEQADRRRSGATARDVADGVRARQADQGRSKKVGPGARHRHHRHLRARPGDLRAKPKFDPELIRERLEVEELPPQGPEGRLERRGHTARRTTFRHDGGIADFLTQDRRRAAPSRRPPSSRFVLDASDNGVRAGRRARVDRGHRRAHPLVRQHHPHPRRRHARERACAPAVVKAVRNYIETHDLTPRASRSRPRTSARA